MIRNVRFFFVFCFLFFSVSQSKAHAIDFVWEITSGIRFNFTNNGWDYSTSTPSLGAQSLGGSLLFGLYTNTTFNKYVSLTTMWDIGEMSFTQSTNQSGVSQFIVLLGAGHLNASASEIQAQEDSVTTCKSQATAQGIDTNICNNPHWLLVESGFLRELYTTLYFSEEQWASLDVGMLSRTLARGLLFDNYALGTSLLFNFSAREGKNKVPLKLRLDVFLPDSSFTQRGKSSPVVNLQADYVFSETRKIGVFFSYLRDGNDLVGRLLLPLWQEFFGRKANEIFMNKSKASSSPNFSCFSDPNYESIKKGLPLVQQKKQAQCEKDNEGKSDSEKQSCPAEEIYNRFYEQSCTILPDSSGNHFWAGIQGEATFGKLKIEGAAVVYFSQYQIAIPKISKPNFNTRNTPTRTSSTQSTFAGNVQRIPSRTSRLPNQTTQPLVEQQITDPDLQTVDPIDNTPVDMKGLAFSSELKLSYELLKGLNLATFFLFATGESMEDPKGSVSSFVAIAPRLLYTNIFFNGGINSFSSARNLSISGISGKGYLVPGTSLSYKWKEKLETKIVLASMWAHQTRILEDGKRSGKWYGFEFNLNASYKVLKWLRPTIEFDVFHAGDFFNDNSKAKTLVQLIAGLDFLFP